MEIEESKNFFVNSNQLLLNKRKGKKSKKQANIQKRIQQRIVHAFAIIERNTWSDMKLSEDLIITSEGQFRLCTALNHMSFGCYVMSCQGVEHIKNPNCFNLQLKQTGFVPTCSLDDAIFRVKNLHCEIDVQKLFQKETTIQKYFQQEIEQYELSPQELQERDVLFKEFIDDCFNYLKDRSTQNIQQQSEQQQQQIESIKNLLQDLEQHDYQVNSPKKDIFFDSQQSLNGILSFDHEPAIFPLLSSLQKDQPYEQQQQQQQFLSFNEKLSTQNFLQNRNEINFCQRSAHNEGNSCKQYSLGMYTYNIGRFNWKSKLMEIIHQGYSEGYLQFLGLDSESFITIEMRNRRIDLIKDKSDISHYSAITLNARNSNNQSCEYVSNITTFDGFPITIYQKTTRIKMSQKFKGDLRCKPEFYFSMTEIDVDMADLLKLMDYRSKLANFPHSLPFDIFVQRELSFKLEDIEYSIHSETFLEKYYKTNLEALKKLRCAKYERAPVKQSNIRFLKQGENFEQIQVVKS